MWLYEIATGSPDNRHHLLKTEELWNVIVEHDCVKPLYKSIYLYNEADVDLISQSTPKFFTGIRWSYYIPIDIDINETRKDGSTVALTDAQVLNKTKRLVQYLFSLGLSEWNLIVWYSGRGYHIDIHSDCFGLEPSERYVYIIKELIATIMKDWNIDMSIYIPSGIIRAPFSINMKTNRIKIPIEISKILSEDLEYVLRYSSDKELALSLAYEFPMNEITGDKELSYLITQDLIERSTSFKAITTKQVHSTVAVDEPDMNASCINSMWIKGPLQGTRHAVILRLASHFKRVGIPFRACVVSLLDWLNPEFDQDEAERLIYDTYQKNYKYSCKDSIMKAHCKTNCLHYKDKNYVQEISCASDMQTKLKEYLGSIGHHSFDIGKIFGKESYLITPGELVTFFGPTGTNKSTVMQCITLGFNMLTQTLMKELTRPTLYLSLELDDVEVHLRNMMIVSGFNREYVSAHPDEVYRITENSINHVKVIMVPPDLEEFERLIKKESPRLVVIDYLDTFLVGIKDKQQASEKTKSVMHALSNLAVKYKIIIFVVSQIRREDAREEKISIYSAVGSGGIENASRKIFEISGKQKSRQRLIRMHKDNFGNCMDDIYVRVNDNYRLTIEEPVKIQKPKTGNKALHT